MVARSPWMEAKTGSLKIQLIRMSQKNVVYATLVSQVVNNKLLHSFLRFLRLSNSNNSHISQMIAWNMSINVKCTLHWGVAMYLTIHIVQYCSTTGFCERTYGTYMRMQVSPSSRFSALRQFISADGLIRVSDRFINGPLSFSEKHSILLAKNIIRHCYWCARRTHSHCMMNHNWFQTCYPDIRSCI